MDPYITVSAANDYFEEIYRENIASWDNATPEDKERALKDATKRIDRLNFIGEMSDSTQGRQFPRYDDTTVPTDIQYTYAEVAFALLDGIDPEREIELLAMKTQGLASARSTFDRTFVLEYLAAGIPSALAWNYLKPYLIDPDTLDIIRAS